MVKDELIELINKRRANIGIIGLGYVGLPLAITFANAGFNVTGIDPNQEKVDSINRGESYILDVPNAHVRKHVEAGRLRATTDYSLLAEIDAVSICVPTPLRKTGDPDLSFIANASESLAPYLHRGMVIVLESSTYPGTTRELVLPKLSECCGLKVGEDFFLAFSPSVWTPDARIGPPTTPPKSSAASPRPARKSAQPGTPRRWKPLCLFPPRKWPR